MGVKCCNPFFAETIYEFAKRRTPRKFAGLREILRITRFGGYDFNENPI
jgi:hypothetical protein